MAGLRPGVSYLSTWTQFATSLAPESDKVRLGAVVAISKETGTDSRTTARETKHADKEAMEVV